MSTTTVSIGHSDAGEFNTLSGGTRGGRAAAREAETTFGVPDQEEITTAEQARASRDASRAKEFSSVHPVRPPTIRSNTLLGVVATGGARSLRESCCSPHAPPIGRRVPMLGADRLRARSGGRSTFNEHPSDGQILRVRCRARSGRAIRRCYLLVRRPSCYTDDLLERDRLGFVSRRSGRRISPARICASQ